LTPCPLCGSTDASTRLRGVPRLGSKVPSRFDVRACGRCGLGWTDPPPADDELREAYGPAYTWQARRGLIARVEARYRQALAQVDQARVVKLASRMAGGRRLLDVGCGDGLLVSEARRLGLEAYGVDRPGAPLWPACDPAWRQEADIETLEQPGDAWDVVSLFHVAEHLRAPADLFRRAHGWIRPGGVFVLQVPNARSLQAEWFGPRWYGFDMPRHLVHWSEPSLRRALTDAGFEVVRVRHVSWRDNGPCLAGSLAPGLDPLVERERAHAGLPPPALPAPLRRLAYLLLVWACVPVTLVESSLRRGATMTVFARRG
jgi:SAM-dependent methyltransferase